jgi:hypothetical protein
MKPWNQRLGKVAQVLLLVLTGFNLGRYAEVFSGNTWAWVALILNLFLLAWLLFFLVREAWQSED